MDKKSSLPGKTPQNQSEPSKDGEEQKMNLFGHLSELRSRLIKGLLAIAVGFVIGWNLAASILRVLVKPVLNLLPDGHGLYVTGLPDGLVITLKTGLWAGVFISAPFWMYQLWAFIAPGLYRHERKRVVGLALLAAVLMAAGAFFAYFLVFPLAFKFFLSFSTDFMSQLLTIDRYCSLAMGMILAFGLAFQLPLILMFLGYIGVLDAAFLKKNRRYAMVVIFIVAAILTPPDVVSQCIMAAALLALYELSIVLMPVSVRSLKE